jgi:hypothetical protein
MLVLGIILILIAAGLLVAALLGGRSSGEPAGFDLGAVHVDTNTITLFLAGAVTVVILVVGLGLVQAGLRRARRRRQERKELNRLKKVEAQEAATPTDTTSPTRTTEAPAAQQTRTDTAVTDPDRPHQ